MATVAELIPGDLVSNSGTSGVFIGLITRHPIWPVLTLVIWRLGNGWSFDALLDHQEVGDVTPSTDSERQHRLRAALLGEGDTHG